MESGKVVLVTAAAGGTGQFAVQVCFQILYRLNHMHAICLFR